MHNILVVVKQEILTIHIDQPISAINVPLCLNNDTCRPFPTPCLYLGEFSDEITDHVKTMTKIYLLYNHLRFGKM